MRLTPPKPCCFHCLLQGFGPLNRRLQMEYESYLGGPGGCREPFGLPGKLQRPTWTAQEAAEGYLDSPGGSRRLFGQPGRLQRAI